MKQNRVRYVIAWYPKSEGWITGIDGSKPMEEGWYVLTFDDEGRMAFTGDAHPTPEDAGRAVFNGGAAVSVSNETGER